MNIQTKVHIIGAGPYGMGLALALKEKNIPFIISGKPFELWHKHTLDEGALRSDFHTAEIGIGKNRFKIKYFLKNYAIEQPLDHRLPMQVYRQYLKSVEDECAFPVNNTYIKSLTHRKGKFLTTQDDGSKQIESDFAVLCTGIQHKPWIPENLVQMKSSNIVHSHFTDRYQKWKDKRIFVIGNGQSAGEAVAQLQKENQIHWIYRSPFNYYSEPLNLPRPVYLLSRSLADSSHFLPEKIRLKLNNKFTQTSMTPDLKNKINFKDINLLQSRAEDIEIDSKQTFVLPDYNSKADKILCCTGYKNGVSQLAFCDNELLKAIEVKNDFPLLGPQFESSLRNLFFSGRLAEPRHGASQMFMMGAHAAAKRIRKAIGKRLKT